MGIGEQFELEKTGRIIPEHTEDAEPEDAFDRATGAEICMFCGEPGCKDAECEDDYWRPSTHLIKKGK